MIARIIQDYSSTAKFVVNSDAEGPDKMILQRAKAIKLDKHLILNDIIHIAKSADSADIAMIEF
ncbi:MAG: hypothetical protein CMO03_01740 [Thalassospira sp.]|uniref:Uncharacterized protein n=1 Tax=Thalassospira xiamenensis TaxID=220697 RepID=A0ABR5XYH6_9PROT|nr:hypothetical protein AUP40_01540 [Thalassospira xiamenensis]MAB32781.1 hypothetical protein [Thalassospira sp.]OHZ00328.1 hypothetical protein BC440_20095 [Thalassospira sp. MIT1004]OSQ31840.1 hypothetical protein TH468_07440 [Thalassospira sp. MCCC 1A03138]MAL28234.1 hypothetical protein [Thalassospira sp.]